MSSSCRPTVGGLRPSNHDNHQVPSCDPHFHLEPHTSAILRSKNCRPLILITEMLSFIACLNPPLFCKTLYQNSLQGTRWHTHPPNSSTATKYNICATRKLKGYTNGKTLHTRSTSSRFETAFHRETDRRTDRTGNENPTPNNRCMDNYGEIRAERFRVDAAKDTRTLQKGEAS